MKTFKYYSNQLSFLFSIFFDAEFIFLKHKKKTKNNLGKKNKNAKKDIINRTKKKLETE